MNIKLCLFSMKVQYRILLILLILLIVILKASIVSGQNLVLFKKYPKIITPDKIQGLVNWYKSDEGIELKNYQVMRWAPAVGTDTLKAYYSDSTAQNNMWYYEDHGANVINSDFTGHRAIVGSPNRQSSMTNSVVTSDSLTKIYITKFGGNNSGYLDYVNGAYYTRLFYQGTDSVKIQYRKNNSVYFNLKEDSLYYIAFREIADSIVSIYVPGIIDTQVVGSFTYSPSYYRIWTLIGYDYFLYDFIVYDKFISNKQLDDLYRDYFKRRYKTSANHPSEVFEYLASDSTNKGVFLGNIAMIGDLQYDSATTVTGWTNANCNLEKLDSAFAFINHGSPFNGDSINLLILLGDITNYSGISEFDSVGVRLKNLNIPYIHYPGNHDNLDTNFVRYQNFYNTYNTYANGIQTMPNYLKIEQDTNTVDDYWIKGTYTPLFDSNILFVIAPHIDNPSEYPDLFRDDYNYAWIDSVVDANPYKNIILLTHEGIVPIKGGIDNKRNYRNAEGIIGATWKDYGYLSMAFNGHHNEFRVIGNEYPTFSWTTGGYNQGLYDPNITYMEIYENKIFVSNYSWDIHYNGGTQSDVATDEDMSFNPYGADWYKNGIWVERDKYDWSNNLISDPPNSTFQNFNVSLDLDGSSKYAYVNNPNELDLNSANYIADSNSTFTGTTVSDWIANGDVSINFVNDSLKFINIATGDTNFISLSQNYFTNTIIHNHNYIIQLGLRTDSNSSIRVKLGNLIDTIATTTTFTNYAFTQQYDSTGMTVAPYQNFNTLNYIAKDNCWFDSSNALYYDASINGGNITFVNDSLILGKKYLVKYKVSNITPILSSGATFRIYGLTNINGTNNYVSHTEGEYSYIATCELEWHNVSVLAKNYSTFFIDDFSIEEVPDLQLFCLTAGDTVVVDDVSISEAYDLDIEGWFKVNSWLSSYLLDIRFSNTGNYINLYSYTNGYIYNVLVQDGISSTVSYNSNSDNTWHNYKIDINRISPSTFIIDNVILGEHSVNDFKNYISPTSITVGAKVGGTNLYNGELGWIKLTKKDGLGSIIGYSYYDWKGNESKYLSDKGTFNNNLTNININISDTILYSSDYSTILSNNWYSINGIISVENDGTLNFQDTTGNGYAYLPLTNIHKEKYKIIFDYINEQNTDNIYYSFAGIQDSITTDSLKWKNEINLINSKIDETDNYYKFSGNDDRIGIGVDFATLYPDSFSVSMWVKFDNLDNLYFIVGNGGAYSSASGLGWSINYYNASSRLYFDTYDTSGVRQHLTMTSVISPNILYHFVATYNNGNKKFYINNSLIGSATETEGKIDNTAGYTFYIGGGSLDGKSYNLEGIVKDVKFYGNRELTSSEVATLYNGGEVSGATLDLQPKNMTETTWVDISGNGNDGTVNGAELRQTELKLWLNKQAKVKIDNVKIYKNIK